MQIFPLNIVPKSPNFDFIKYRILFYIISTILVFLSVFYILFYKLNFGIDFIGGTLIELDTREEINIENLRKALSPLKIGDILVQEVNNDNRNYSIKLSSKKNNLLESIELIKSELKKSLNIEPIYKKIDFVGPQVSQKMISSGIISICLSILSIMFYIWIRFNLFFSIGIFFILIHNLTICIGFISIFQYEFSLGTIAALLTIIGYCVNDSIVIYDKIRHNLSQKYSYKPKDLINKSTNLTLSRTVITSLSTLAANLALILFGGEAIRSFASLVFFGVFIGTYASIFISNTLLYELIAIKYFKIYINKKISHENTSK